MRITSLKIDNFRSIKALDVELGETTVFIGPNNAGRQRFLMLSASRSRAAGVNAAQALQVWRSPAPEADDRKSSPGVSIVLRAEEATAGESPEDATGDEEISQTDPVTGKSSITLNVQCSWSESDGFFQPVWVFLNAARQPLVGGSARRVNSRGFWQYVPVFYLSALRDAEDEFTSRSQFWGRLLKAMEIPPKLESRVQQVLDRLNTRLLNAALV